MINFIIVEDNKEVQKEIRNVVLKSTFQLKAEIKTECFCQYDETLDSIINNSSLTKIYILDIELPGQYTGIEIAQKVRERDINSPIIIVTSHDSLFETVYRTLLNIFDFIEKIGDFQKILSDDLAVILEHNYDFKSLVYTNRNISLQVKYQNIIYIYRETTERKIVVITDTNKYILPLTLIDVQKLLDDRFVQVHRACIINKKRIDKYDWVKGYFITDNLKNVNLLSKKYRGRIDDDK